MARARARVAEESTKENADGRRDGPEIGTNRIIPSAASPESSPSRRATMLALSTELRESS